MSTVIGFSKGLYSSWFYYAPTRSLFDCGEGCASFLGNKVFAVENIFLSHGHIDHIAGLPVFIGARNSAMGDHEKPLNIYYPENCRPVTEMFKFIDSQWHSLRYKINWIQLDRFQEVGDIKTFPTCHGRFLTLGYKVRETRQRLKYEYRGQNIPDLLRSGTVDRANLMEEYKANIWVYSLDSNNQIDAGELHAAETWVADTTFLDIKDRDDNTHSTLGEVITLAYMAKVKHVYCAHFSSRYEIDQIYDAVKKEQANHPSIKLTPIMPNRLFNS